MPVMLADAIGNVSLDSISDYVAFDGYEGSPACAATKRMVWASIWMDDAVAGRRLGVARP